MAVTKEKKEEILKNLEEKFGKAKAVYFSDYRGLTVKEMGALRSKLSDEGAEYLVAKKTLIKLSVKNANLPELPDGLMEGPVGAVFGYDDVVIPVKVLNDFAKEAEALTILGGLVDGKYITKEEAIQLAKLPSRDELLAKLVGSMKSPISGFHGVLAGLLRNFVGTVKAYQDKKGEEVPAEEAKTEEKADAPAEEAKVEAKAETPAEEAKTEEKSEDPAEEAKVEAKAETPAEEAKTEEKTDAPVEEAKEGETPAKEEEGDDKK